MSAVLEAQGLRKVYRGGDGNPIEVLSSVDFTIDRGEFVAIVGASGSGKSTLLHLLGGLDTPSAGAVRLDGDTLSALTPEALGHVRNRKVGFVFQFHHLLREFTALENVMMPLLIARTPESAARSRAEELLATVGLAGRMAHRPGALSGGEQQRVAVARALANKPPLILADEPTGNLDEHTADVVFAEFLQLVRGEGSAALVATHNERIAAKMDRVVRLHEGRLQ
jgi:lipoprotein-releasing system ATP-binding protein